MRKNAYSASHVVCMYLRTEKFTSYNDMTVIYWYAMWIISVPIIQKKSQTWPKYFVLRTTCTKKGISWMIWIPLAFYSVQQSVIYKSTSNALVKTSTSVFQCDAMFIQSIWNKPCLDDLQALDHCFTSILYYFAITCQYTE